MGFIKAYKNIWQGLGIVTLLITFRMYHTQTFAFGFLFWNIFLAVLPLYFSHKVLHSPKPSQALFSVALWLFFFPNSAYLFTDTIHLHHRHGMIYWLDMVILLLAGIYGIVIGLLSLKQMEGWYGQFVKPGYKQCITFIMLMACGYGIYLGRVERWNSWDIVAQPLDLFSAIFNHSRHPFQNKEVWMMSLLFGLGLWVLYQLPGRIKFTAEIKQ